MKEIINKYFPYVLFLFIMVNIAITIYSINKKTPSIEMKDYYNKEVLEKIHDLNNKIDSIKTEKEIIYNNTTKIIERQAKEENEIIKTEDIDSLIILFNKHFSAGKSVRF